jgi:hypothetical protein
LYTYFWLILYVAVRMSSDSISCAYSIRKTNVTEVSFWKNFPKLQGIYCLAHPNYTHINVLNTLIFQFVWENMTKQITLKGEAH